MNDFKQPISQVEAVLVQIKTILDDPNFDIDQQFILYNRPENNQTLEDLHYNVKDVCQVIRQLNASNYSSTQLDDKSGLSPEYLFVFGKTVKHTPLYIKLKLVRNRIIVCISFHEEKYKMNYHYG